MRATLHRVNNLSFAHTNRAHNIPCNRLSLGGGRSFLKRSNSSGDFSLGSVNTARVFGERLISFACSLECRLLRDVASSMIGVSRGAGEISSVIVAGLDAWSNSYSSSGKMSGWSRRGCRTSFLCLPHFRLTQGAALNRFRSPRYLGQQQIVNCRSMSDHTSFCIQDDIHHRRWTTQCLDNSSAAVFGRRPG